MDNQNATQSHNDDSDDDDDVCVPSHTPPSKSEHAEEVAWNVEVPREEGDSRLDRIPPRIGRSHRVVVVVHRVHGDVPLAEAVVEEEAVVVAEVVEEEV